jgi:hypothetical protein
MPVGTTRLARVAAPLPPVGIEEPRTHAAEAHLGGTQTPGDELARAPLTPARLAAGTGATMARSESGAETVTFAPPPDSPTAAASSTPAEPAPAAVATVAAGDAGASPRPAPAPGTAPPEIDVDEVYDRVVERLRHDLVTEYERIGRPLDHLPHC